MPVPQQYQACVVNAGYAQITIAIGQAAVAAIHIHAQMVAGD